MSMNSELDKALDALAEYEAIYGTCVYTGNSSRDKEYAVLKANVKRLAKA
jgi:hypothetical protein